MSGYWETIPRGTWSIIDPTDALDSLKDSESRAAIDIPRKRINVVGPLSKALIIDLPAILDSMSDEDKIVFMTKVEELIGYRFTII